MSLLAKATKSVGVPSISEDGTYITAPLSWLPWLRSGTVMTEEGSMSLSTVYACIQVLSQDVASLPLFLYRRMPDGGREKATDHPLFRTLHLQPNPEMTSVRWRQVVMVHLLTWGNHYSEIVFDGLGRLQLWPLHPARMEVKWEDGTRAYYYQRGNDAAKKLREGSVFHVMGQSVNGLVGLSPIAVHRETLGEHAATREFGQAFYRNMARPATVLKHPKALSADAQGRLAAQLDALKGSKNAGKTVVLEEGLDFKEIGIPPEDAQYIETRKLQREEQAQLYRMPPHKVGILDHATFSNIEHQAIDYVTGTLRPWLVTIEQEIATQLIDEEDIYAEMLVDALLRGDAKSRAEALSIRWQNGTLTPDEWRALENENALPDGIGSQTYIPSNYKRAKSPVEPDDPAAEEPTPIPIDESAAAVPLEVAA